MLTALCAAFVFAGMSPSIVQTTPEEKTASLLNVGPSTDVLGHYEDIETKKRMPVTRADVIEHLKTIGFNVSMPQPLSQLKTLETKTAAFLLVLRYVLQLANKELAVSADQELAERIKATTAQLTFGHFLGKQVLSKIDVNAIRQEALDDVKNKHKGEYGYDIFVVVTDSVDKAKAVHEKVQALHDKHDPSLVQDLEALARETHKEIDEKQLTNPAFIAAKKTNGWLLPRQMIQKQTNSSDLTFLIRGHRQVK